MRSSISSMRSWRLAATTMALSFKTR